MRLVIHSQGAAEAGLRRYNGRGIFSSIGRKLFSFGLKKVINAVEKENHQHTISDALVNTSRPINKKKEKGKNCKCAAKKEKTKVDSNNNNDIFTFIKSKKIFKKDN